MKNDVSKRHKNLLILLGLCALLVVCIVLYLLVPKGGESEEGDSAEEAAQEITVDTIAGESIQKIEVKKDGKATYSLVKKGAEWKLSGQEKIPLDESKVMELFDCLNPVKATKTLDRTVEAISEYGLEKPAYTIIVTADGKEYQYDLGIEVPVEGGYYGLSSSNGDSIYCLSDSLVSDLDIDTKTLMVKDELPEIEEDYMVYLNVDNSSGRDFEALVVDEEDRVDTYSKWNITKPYKKPLATSIKDWSTILGYFNALTLGNLVEYDAENLDKYGLKYPSSVITIRYFETTADYEPEANGNSAGDTDSDSEDTEEEETVPEKYRKYHTLTICVGKKTGESYYVCMKGSNNVYLGNGDVVEKMTKLNVFDAMDHCVYATLATKINGYEAIYGDTKLSVTRTPVEKTDDFSAEETSGDKAYTKNKEQNIWTLNGKTISAEDESEFLTPYSSAYLLEYTAKADDSVKPKNKKPVLTMIYHEENRDVTVTYYPYDGTNFYRVDRDGMNYFLVDKRSVDDIVKRFKNIEKFAK